MSPVRPAIAPVVLGCCPGPARCVLCVPAAPSLAPAAIRAVLQARTEADRPVQLNFYGGPPPTDAQLAAADGAPIGVRVRPDLLSRADAARLIAAGVVHIELDALSLNNDVLKAAGRTHRRALVLEQLQALSQMPIELGIVLAPGLPRSSFELAVQDARDAVPFVDVARLHPVQVLRHSGLYQAMLDGQYEPLTLGEAVTVCRAMLDLFEAAGVRVIRIGQQGGPDGLGVVAAGPAHSSFRELVEARRTLDTVRGVLREAGWVDGRAPGGHVEVVCAPADVSRTRGPFNQHVRTLRAEYGLDELSVRADPTLPRGHFRVNEKTG